MAQTIMAQTIMAQTIMAQTIMAQTMQLTDLIKSCLDSGDYSDLTIKCGDETFNVHKVIVCTQVGFFARAIKFGGKETQENVIHLPDDDPKIIRVLIRYLYTGQYESELLAPPDPARDEQPKLSIIFSETHNEYTGGEYAYEFPHSCNLDYNAVCSTILLCPHHFCDYHCRNNCNRFLCDRCCIPEAVALNCLVHSEMYTLADKYEVMGLTELSRRLFTLSCKAMWNNDAFLEAIDHAFSTTVCTNLGLREPIMEVISEHMELMHKPELQAWMAEHNDLDIGVLLKNAERLIPKTKEIKVDQDWGEYEEDQEDQG